MINLVLMTIIWTTTTMDYYMVLFFLKYVPGNIFMNTSLSCVADLIAYGISGVVMHKLGVKASFIVAFLLAAAGGFLMICFFRADGGLMAFLVLFTKFGIAFSFNLCYISMPSLFPPEILATAFGVCNLVARFSTILAPLVAELPDPAPMACFTVTCIGSALLPLCLRKVQNHE